MQETIRIKIQHQPPKRNRTKRNGTKSQWQRQRQQQRHRQQRQQTQHTSTECLHYALTFSLYTQFSAQKAICQLVQDAELKYIFAYSS